jgi:hypothetical protein
VSIIPRISVSIDGRVVSYASTFNNAVVDARTISAGHPAARVVIKRGDTVLAGYRAGRPLRDLTEKAA